MDRWTIRCAGVFILSTATLMLQVAFTRVFSIALWHHFVWMIISIALLGYAASGTFLSVFGDNLGGDLDKTLTVSSSLFSASTILSFIASNKIKFDPFTFAWNSLQLLNIGAYYVLLLIPFFFSGLTIGLIIAKSKNRINRVYFSSFLGSAFGTLFILPLFKPLGGSGAIIFISILGAFSALAFASLSRKIHVPLILWASILVIILASARDSMQINISPYKGLSVALRYPESRLLETRWNEFSRVDVVESGYVRYAPGLSLRYTLSLPEQIGVFVDGDSLNAIYQYNGISSSLNFTNFLPAATPYMLVTEPKVLVINSGGGLGVLSAIYHGATTVSAVEENPIIVDLLKNEYARFSGNIYSENLVDVHVSDGRSFIHGCREKFNIIELSMTGGTSASSTGIYALSEDYTYTVESFKSLIEHLSDDGFLSISRWLLPPPREDIRVVSLALAALESMEIEEPWRHLAVIRSWATLNLVVGKSPLSEPEVASIRSFCRDRGFDIVYVPGVDVTEVNVYNKFPEPIYFNIVNKLVEEVERDNFYKKYLYDITPTWDEKPFFFNFFKWGKIIETYNNLDKRWQALIEGGFLVPIVLLQALVISVLIVVLPLSRLGDVKGKTGLIYFLLIGLGYMFIEITTIQRFILVLGNPVHSISFVLFSLLFSSGLGSYSSNRVEPLSMRHLLVIKLLGGLSILFCFLSNLIEPILSLSFSARLLVTFLLIFPLGFLMGMPFPLGIRMHSDSRESFIGWAWAVNGCASVLGSILPMTIALHLGFSKIYLIAGILYGLNIFLLKRDKVAD